ncbi:MAG TPA: tetratricopeptide repeat protein, partial [Planctomycetota bacterium]|nr:tetratricopeptide repeat protein [Planctomycetota bacterium]
EKYKNYGELKPAEVWRKGIGSYIIMQISKIIKKWDTVIDHAENFLQYDPKNIPVLFALGEACMHANYLDTSISVFENILAFDGNHVKALKALGKICEKENDLEKAKHYYQRALKINPSDDESEKLVKDLSAQITANTYGQAKSSHELLRDQEKAKDLEDEQAILRTDEDYLRAIERTKKKLASDPKNRKDLRRLGELYQKSARYDQAVEVYNQILQLDPTNADIKNRITECKVDRMDFEVRSIREKLQKNPNDERLKQEYQRAMKRKLEVEIQEYSQQIQSQPTNMDLRHKLGLAYFQAAKFDDAIAQFQFSVKDPRKKNIAHSYMGQAFMKKQEFDIAIEHFQSVLDSISPKEREYKEAMYWIGQAHEAAGHQEEALEAYTTIYREDINFKDVQARLKKLRN